MKGVPTGDYVDVGKGIRAFLPHQLPRTVEFTSDIVALLGSASVALGGLRALATSPLTFPMQGVLTGPMLRREATASSQIEGTRTNLRQFMEFEASDERIDSANDAREVANLLKALTLGLDRGADQPITAHLLRELQSILLAGARGGGRALGEYRNDLVFIGTSNDDIARARYIPPPALDVAPLMNDLISAIQQPPHEIPPLIRIAMIHYQFEAIHPFDDGNGRTGRLLISLLLAEWDLLPLPLLSLSETLEARRRDYVDGLLGVSRDGDWEGWITFFLGAVEAQARQDGSRLERLLLLREEWRARYAADRSPIRQRLIDALMERPVLTTAIVSDRLGCSINAAQKAIETFTSDGLLREITGYARNRIYVADAIMDIVMPRS